MLRPAPGNSKCLCVWTLGYARSPRTLSAVGAILYFDTVDDMMKYEDYIQIYTYIRVPCTLLWMWTAPHFEIIFTLALVGIYPFVPFFTNTIYESCAGRRFVHSRVNNGTPSITCTHYVRTQRTRINTRTHTPVGSKQLIWLDEIFRRAGPDMRYKQDLPFRS